MTELTSTRANPMIDPALHVWGWEIPVYLFLGGMVAGMLVISGYFLFSGRYRNTRCVYHVLPGLGFVLLSVGMFALFLDLEHKAYFWRLYTTFMVRSPMSWGAWILILVYPALVAGFLLRPPPMLARRLPWLERMSSVLARPPRLVKWIGALSMFLGTLLGVYTGVLLSALGARPLWNSALLGPIFLVSGMSAAAALTHMIAREKLERELLAKADNGLLVLELILIGLMFVGLASATAVHMEALKLFFGGPYTAALWVFVIGIGIVVPLGLQLLAVRHMTQHTPIPPLLVIAGGIALRFVIVAAGQSSSWTIH